MGDIASKGTGGGIISANTHGPTKFIGPGSFDVKIEGKNVQYLGDPMINNCGSPSNSATTPGEIQSTSTTSQANSPDSPCGGPHKLTKQPTNDGLDSHHIPAKDSYKHTKLDKDNGPAIKMTPEDHRQTASYGSSADAVAYRQRQKDLIDQNKFLEAVEEDIKDIQSKFPGKYDDCLDQMLKYAATL